MLWWFVKHACTKGFTRTWPSSRSASPVPVNLLGTSMSSVSLAALALVVRLARATSLPSLSFATAVTVPASHGTASHSA
jgi:Na+-driven multidrug efflux pump